MDPAPFLPMYAFNTWANEHLRTAVASAPEETLRRPLDLWFGSVFNIVAHLCAGEAVWLARLRDRQNPTRLLTATDFPTGRALVDTWRDLDYQWEAYLATLTSVALEDNVTWTSQFGGTFIHRRWQLLMHAPFHSSEHRAHAATGLTALGIGHGPQDFHLQFMPPDAVAARIGSTPPTG